MADRCWVSILIDVVDRFDGSVIVHPSELARDGREVAEDWLRCGWPATGLSVVKLLTSRAEELLTTGLQVHHTPPGPGQPEWIAVTDVSAAPRRHPRLDPASLVPTPRPNGGKQTRGWPTQWKKRAET